MPKKTSRKNIKSFLQSKTIWVNGIALILVLVVLWSVFAEYDLPGLLERIVGVLILVIPLVNVLLRFVTNEAIELKLPKK